MSDDVLRRVSEPGERIPLGNRLRIARETKGLSLKDVEAATRIRVRYLEALETGNYGVMPGGEAQIRGFLRRYASFLGISPDDVILWYEQETRRESAEVASGGPRAAKAAPVSSPPSVPSAPSIPSALRASRASRSLSLRPIASTEIRAPWLLVLIIVLILGGLALGVVWLTTHPGRVFLGGVKSTPVVSPARPMVFPSPLATAVPSSPTPFPTPTAAPTFPVSTSGVTLTLEAREHVWVRVTVDGFTAFEGMLSPANPQTWVGNEMVIVETGNGAGVVAIVNGQSQGPLCGRGEVCTRGWGPTGEIEVSR
ncbi:MAG: helix-turn-helix domain-containing protein [Anaerolineae bacterium]|nr:helix-turn-helix domain-containing protein [Anaerolineae bacterium]MCX8068483.1 helix-turn-helix domain-containing protein [Anaerolineae bacterium]MDW7992799.1 helix-turn-helix domain-containing protein [Anaerolineae bacterium]